MATPLKTVEPDATHLLPDARHGPIVVWQSVVGIVTSQHAPGPSMLLSERVVRTLPCFTAKLEQLPGQALALRLVLHEETLTARPSTVVRELNEGEPLRPTLPPAQTRCDMVLSWFT